MKSNPLLQVRDLGQSVWLDFIRRGMLATGELRRLIRQDGIRGVTSNPAIFEKAITGSHDYDEAIRRLVPLTRNDEFRPMFDQLDGRDGFVSLEVSPHLAADTAGTVREARRLWAELNRPNVLIKVPGTPQGLPAIRELISEGISVNVTLLFGLPRYREVTEAYLAGLEARLKAGKPLQPVASVASFFLSRIDVLVDPILDKKKAAGGELGTLAASLQGQTAIASAKLAYAIYKDVFGGKRFRKLKEAGAHPQRVLWASTGTKNPAYSDVKYVEALIGQETIDTIPLETLDAYRDHGQPALRLEEGMEDAPRVLENLRRLSIDIDQVTQQLEDEGIEKFVKPFDQLMAALREKHAAPSAASQRVTG